MPPTFYYREDCPFCEKVRLALLLDGLEHEPVGVDPDDPEPVRKISGQNKVPVLVDGDNIVTGSNRILRR